MEIFNDIIQFFSLTHLYDCETFPEFISCLVEVIIAVSIVIYMFKAVFYTCFRIYDIK